MSNQQNIFAPHKLCFLANQYEKRVIRCRKCNNEEKNFSNGSMYVCIYILK